MLPFRNALSFYQNEDEGGMEPLGDIGFGRPRYMQPPRYLPPQFMPEAMQYRPPTQMAREPVYSEIMSDVGYMPQQGGPDIQQMLDQQSAPMPPAMPPARQPMMMTRPQRPMRPPPQRHTPVPMFLPPAPMAGNSPQDIIAMLNRRRG